MAEDVITQEIINIAVSMANKAGLDGKRVNILWIPPQSASSPPYGSFAIQYLPLLSGGDNVDKGRW